MNDAILNEISAEIEQLENLIDEKKAKYRKRLAIITGNYDNIDDEMRKFEEKMMAAYNGTDAISQFQAEAAEESRKIYEESQQAKAKRKKAQEEVWLKS